MVSKEEAKEKIKELIEKYKTYKKEGKLIKINEANTKSWFIEPLFNALGWDFSSDDVFKEENVLKGRVDYAFRLNGVTRFFLEAKPLAVDLEKHLKQAIEYGWHRGITWVVLTNFEELKVYNSEWNEKNLSRNIVFGMSYDRLLIEFDRLWMLSNESFKTNELDKWAEKEYKRKPRRKISEHLLSEFIDWRTKLVSDLKKNYPDYTENDRDEMIQVLLNRIIFIRNCEDRKFEEEKLKAALTHQNINKSIKEAFRYYDQNYDSSIFESREIDKVDFNGKLLHNIIERVYKTQDGNIVYDFSLIDADILGNLYEQYLSHISKKSDDKNNAKRKSQGIYYTPTYIVDYIVKNTVGEILKDRKINLDKIRILDPACGSGSFLIKTFDVLNEHYRKKKSYEQSTLGDEIGTTYSTKEKILMNNIFGVDLDKQAVEITQLNLLLKIAEKGHKLPILRKNIQEGNSLIDDEKVAGDKAFKWEEKFKQVMDEGGFDVVIGNPPYVRSEINDPIYQKQRKWMESSGQYIALYEKWDLFVAFIERGLKLLKDGGYLSFIISNSFNTSKYADKIKKYILDNSTLIQVDFFKDVEVFKGVGVESVIITIQKKKNRTKTKRVLHIGDFHTVQELEPSNDIDTLFRISSSMNFKKKFNNTELLGHICFISKGMVIHAEETNWRGEFTKDDLISDIPTKVHIKKYLEAKDIERYRIKKIKYLEWNTDRSPKKLSRPTFQELYIHPKIIRGRTTEGTYDEEGIICNESACVFVPYHSLSNISNRSIDISILKSGNKPRKELEKISLNYNIKYVLAILNSKFAKYYLNTIRRHRIEGYFYSDDFKKLPIKKVSMPEQQVFVKLVDKMLSLNKRFNEIGDKKTDERARVMEEIKKTDREIDGFVYRIYDITEKEKQIIEESLK